MDGGESEVIVANTTLHEASHRLSLSVSGLNRYRLWSVSILAYGCSDHTLVPDEPEVYLSGCSSLFLDMLCKVAP